MFVLVLFCVLSAGALAASLTCLIKQKFQPEFCKRVDDLYGNFLTCKERFSYKKLPKSNAQEKIIVLEPGRNKKLFCERLFCEKYDFLKTLASSIDLKINSLKLTFRAKNKRILIDQISWVVAYSAIISNDCTLFKTYKKLYATYKLKLKEHKIFKVLLGQKLIYLLYEIQSEICDISRVIEVAKHTVRIKKYKKKIYFFAQLYAVKKFHPNSTKLLSDYKCNYSKLTAMLLVELSEIEKKQKIIISYLISMFS